MTISSSISGMIASSIGKSILHPIDTVKAKIQVQSAREIKVGESKSIIIRVVRETIAKEGLGGLYKGFSINILGSIPAAALYFGGYELFKTNTLQIKWLQEHPSIAYLAGGMFAETIACVLFVPVDVIKERRQV